jgi:hypothetical protein
MTDWTDCAIRAKHWVLRHYLWVTIALLVVALGVALCIRPDSWQEWFGVLAFPFAFLVAVQKQKTEELALFKELFTEFNERYDEMNEALNAIIAGPDGTPLTPKERDRLFDYFNLCGEEFLFYRQGYIYPEVWQAWRNGMKFFYNNPRVKELWDAELKNDSYYGFRWK